MIMNKPTIFVSHIHEDKDFAIVLKEWIENNFLGAVDMFVSSSSDSLLPGSEWPQKVKCALEEALICLLIISPKSVTRRWIYFEAGASYVKGLPVVPLCVAGQQIGGLYPPLSFFQAIDLVDEQARHDLLKLIAKKIGMNVPEKPAELRLPNRVVKLESLAHDGQRVGVVRILANRYEFDKIRVDLYKQASEILWVSWHGANLSPEHSFVETILCLLKNKTRIHILTGGDAPDLLSTIERLEEINTKNNGHGEFEYRIFRGKPQWYIQMIDERMFAQPYIHNFSVMKTPMFEIKRTEKADCFYIELLRFSKGLWKFAETRDQFLKKSSQN